MRDLISSSSSPCEDHWLLFTDEETEVEVPTFGRVGVLIVVF